MHSWKLYAEVLVFAAVVLVVTPASSATIAVGPGDSIPAAVAAAAPGDTISFSPGVYTISTPVSIAKPLTLRGPQAGVDPRPSAGSARTPGGPNEAVLRGNGNSMVLLIYADSVTVDGLDLANSTGLVYLNSTGARKNPVVRYCILRDAGGMGAVSFRQTDAACLENNYIVASAAGAFTLDYGVGCVIRNNEIGGAGAGITVRNSYGSAIGATIQGNVIKDVSPGAGIALGNESGVDESRSGGSITDNVLHDVSGDAIAVFTSDTLVGGNDVSGCSGANGAIYLANRISGVVVTGNTIRDNGAIGVRVGKQHRVVADVRVNDNTISSNSIGLLYVWANASPNLDATGNDWGDVSGPSGGGIDPASGAVADGSGDSIMEALSTGYGAESEPCPSVHVLFDPWGGAGSSAPPVATLWSPNPSVLWPANGKPVTVTIAGSVIDPDGDLRHAWLVIDDEYGELDGTQDVTAVLGPDGTFETSITLLARRDGKDRDGREYAVTLHALDAAGNEASDMVFVVVPHDMGRAR